MNRLFRLFVSTVMFLSLFFVTPQSAAQDNTTPLWPSQGWQYSTPEEQGVDSQALSNLLQSNSDVHTVFAIRHGKVVLDASRYPFSSDQPHALFTVTKSFVSTLVGIAIDKGYMKSVNQSIWDFFPKDKTANMDARKEAITIENLLTQKSGLNITWDQDLNFYKMVDDNANWVQLMLDKPMQSQPGTAYLDLDAHAHLLSALIQNASKMSTLDFANKYLFEPLGISDAKWLADPQGVNTGGDHLYMSPSSMAKLGYLYLHGGQWDGQQIVSAEWINNTIRSLIPGDRANVGYLWWNSKVPGTEHAMFGAVPIGWQEIWVVPDLDLVVVATNDTGYIGQTIIMSVANAVISDQLLPVNPTAANVLQAQIDVLAHPKPTAINPMPDVAQVASGKVYALQPNDFGWTSFSLDFANPDEAVMTIGLADKDINLPVGLDNVYRVSIDGLPAEPLRRPIADVPLMLKAGFLGKRMLVSMADCMGMEFWTLYIDFSKDGSKLWISAQSLNEVSDETIISHDLVGAS